MMTRSTYMKHHHHHQVQAEQCSNVSLCPCDSKNDMIEPPKSWSARSEVQSMDATNCGRYSAKFVFQNAVRLKVRARCLDRKQLFTDHTRKEIANKPRRVLGSPSSLRIPWMLRHDDYFRQLSLSPIQFFSLEPSKIYPPQYRGI